MLYLVTGSNGAGKTLNTLKWVRTLQLENTDRPVFYNGRFKLRPEKEAEFGWKKFDFADWEKLPDGSICIVDECHNDLPVRPAGQRPPSHIAALAEHRSRGFDFYLITQHPSNLDSFVRRLIGSPGWHRHLRRPFGRDFVSCAQFDAVNLQCEKTSQWRDAQVTRHRFPIEVYSWYDSAVIHTGKKTLPKQVYILAGGIVLAPLLFWWSISGMTGSEAGSTSSGPVSTPVESVGAGLVSGGGGGGRQTILSKEDWLKLFEARIPGLPHTAARYDRVTEPIRAPVPAACIESRSAGCICYTQQGTRMPNVSTDFCRQIVNEGFFVDFEPEPQNKGRRGESGIAGINE